MSLASPQNTVEAVDAIVLSGGSPFRLGAAGGVRAALRGQGHRHSRRTRAEAGQVHKEHAGDEIPGPCPLDRP
jgi:L-aminopeptidase/D-esterase-like protein